MLLSFSNYERLNTGEHEHHCFSFFFVLSDPICGHQPLRYKANFRGAEREIHSSTKNNGLRWGRVIVGKILWGHETHNVDVYTDIEQIEKPEVTKEEEEDPFLEYIILACCGTSIGCLTLSLLVYSINRY